MDLRGQSSVFLYITTFPELREISFIPESIGNLTNLEELNLYENQLTTLPKSIENLNNITELYLWGNKYTKESKQWLRKHFGDKVDF